MASCPCLPAIGGEPDGRESVAEHAASGETCGLVDIGTQRQVHGFPQSHPAGPDELARLVIAFCLSGRYDGVSLHLIRSVSGSVGISCAYASSMAPRACSLPSTRSAGRSKAGGCSSVLRTEAATKIAFLPGNGRKRYGCVTPTRLAIASVEVP